MLNFTMKKTRHLFLKGINIFTNISLGMKYSTSIYDTLYVHDILFNIIFII